MLRKSFTVRFHDNAERIRPETIKRANALSTPLLSDVMGCFGGMDYAIKPVAVGRPICGTAITVSLRPGDNLFLHKALYGSGKGYVLVVDAGGCTTNAPLGEILTTAAEAVGLEGIILDGVVRDIRALRRMKLPIYARGCIPTGGDKDGPGEINVPISCGGVPVKPGDLVLADDDGVVVVARERVEEVLALAEAKAAQEEQRIQAIKEGRLEPSWLNAKLEAFGPL